MIAAGLVLLAVAAWLLYRARQRRKIRESQERYWTPSQLFGGPPDSHSD